MFIAADFQQFKADFAAGLTRMLHTDGLGAFILVLANSMQDRELRGLLQADLLQAFGRLLANQPDAPEDDRAVFVALAERGIDGLGCWEYGRQGWLEVVINPLRSLRPARVSSEVFSQLQQPFSPDKFHFNKPFLRPEILWEGAWGGAQMRVLYNKFPFAPWHLLVVPDPAQQLPQFLAYPHHERMMQLVAECAPVLPGFGLGFNSVGAYASVNQLHFQGFVRHEPLPVEAAHWRHNGGETAYPWACIRIASVQDSWAVIAGLHQRNQPYNLLYRPGVCYVFPRLGQGLETVPDWMHGMAWHEVSGVLTVSDRRAIPTESDLSW